MSQATLLIELRSEELPPKSLRSLSQVFAGGVFEALRAEGFIGASAQLQSFATPRRLALAITEVSERQADREILRRGPPVAAGIGANGQPSPALIGSARSCGVEVADLQQGQDDKGRPCYVFRAQQPGRSLDELLAELVRGVLAKLPIAKLMRWGAGSAQFVRPVHGFFMLHGAREVPVPGGMFGLTQHAARTLGHRFLGGGEVRVDHAERYAESLARDGAVIAEFDRRRSLIEQQLRAAAGSDTVLLDGDLLDEVTALVEAPAVYQGKFDPAFLLVPQECLIVSMRQHQKYFPLADATGRLLPRFLLVSNLPCADPRNIVAGNERVLRARLADAKFFFDQDRTRRLESRVERLAEVVFHNKLGTQLQRVERIAALAQFIAGALGTDAAEVARAARLAKADLLTDMVAEFPELQGLMGMVYARHDGESEAVALALREQYLPRFAGDVLPESSAGLCLALADRLDSLVGLFGCGERPTGEKDPFGLRRHALAMVRILLERGLALDVLALLRGAEATYAGSIAPVSAELFGFVLERLRYLLRERGYAANEVEAVLSQAPSRLDQVPARLDAVRRFADLAAAENLARANKRVLNILAKNATGVATAAVQTEFLIEPAERALFAALQQLAPRSTELVARGDYVEALSQLAAMREPVDAFFDHVMVMAEEPDLRRNRVNLLRDLGALMNQVADISKLAL